MTNRHKVYKPHWDVGSVVYADVVYNSIKMKSFSVIILIVFLLNSCSVINDTVQSSLYEKADGTMKSLDGTYANTPSRFAIEEFRGTSFTDESNLYLWNIFDNHKGFTNDERINCRVEIEFLKSSKAEVRLTYKDSIFDRRIIRGKFKDGYFYKRPLFVVIPLFPIAFGYNTMRYRIGINEDQNLIIEKSWNTYAFALIAGSDTKAQVFAEFNRK